MKPRKPLKRTPIKRTAYRLECKGGTLRRVPIKRTAVKKRARRAKPGDDPKYRKWLARNCACVVCVLGFGVSVGQEWMRMIIDPCHTKTGGVALKSADRNCAALCRAHHSEYDAGRKKFEKKYAVNMPAEASKSYAIYQLEKGSKAA